MIKLYKDAEVAREDQTFPGFLKWLHSLPPKHKFCHELRINSCPIAQFTGQNAYKDSPEHRHSWRNDFMHRYDAATNNSSLKTAIRIAEEMAETYNPAAFK